LHFLDSIHSSHPLYPDTLQIRYIMSLKAEQTMRQEGPLHILITGSSQGIGLAAAQQLIQQGHTVYHACRSHQRAEEAVKAAGGGIALEACDLADLESVQKFARHVETRVPRLDVLCLNAGISPSASATTPHLTAQGFEEAIGVNHIGHFLLMQLLVSKLTAGPFRIVLTASSVHDPALKAGQSGGKPATLGDITGLGINLIQNPRGATMVDGGDYHGGKVYKDSKLCNILTCRQASKEFPTTITTVSFNPGFVPTTGLFDSLRQESWWKAQALMAFASIMGFSVPVQVAASRLVNMVTANNLQNGAYYCAPSQSKATTSEEGFVMVAVSKEAANDEVAARLWNRSMEIVKEWL
jgi:light-dependent protochlorophyllide reductase